MLDFLHGRDQSRSAFGNLVQKTMLIFALFYVSLKCLSQLTEAGCTVRRPFP